MKRAETVTFGSSGLNRAAEKRGSADALAEHDEARAILLWRGKPLVDDAQNLVRLPMDHAILRGDATAPIFLGLNDAHPVFAVDISAWEAPDLDAEQMAQFFDASENSHPLLDDGQRFVELRGVMAQLTRMDAELSATARGLYEWHRIHGFCANCGAKSEIAQSGWQRNCPDCGRSHFPRTDPVVIMLITHGNSVLLGRAPNWPDQMYSCLAGFMEPGETVENAVRREVWEEAGIKVGQVSYLTSQPWAFPSSLMIGCHGDALSRDITIDPVELQDAQWFSKETVLDSFAGHDTGLSPARNGSIANFLIRNWLKDTLD